ncbi:hypothetical protein L596_015431 [Steinernema carpocapsae]|uniref:Uncharacterized protein n=1 Tax=Steinernema carpocapsae TaxID=34508 RepID=A0A4U5NFV2_STECR|nr:hypothetical protein L596_015431 [Steinernema carpocapsae]
MSGSCPVRPANGWTEGRLRSEIPKKLSETQIHQLLNICHTRFEISEMNGHGRFTRLKRLENKSNLENRPNLMT